MFSCDYSNCEKSYTTRNRLKEHVFNYHENKRLTCEYQGCEKSFAAKTYRAIHVRSYHKGERWLCKLPNCKATFTSPSELSRHIKDDHRNVKHTCADCDTEFKYKVGLDRHIEKQKCKSGFSKKETDKIVCVEAHLADIDSQIKTVAALISGLDSVECEDCFLNK